MAKHSKDTPQQHDGQPAAVDTQDSDTARELAKVPTPQPAEYAEFHANGSSKEQAQAWLADLRGRNGPPDGHDLASVSRCVAEAQAIAGEDFDPLVKDSDGIISEQRRWYEIALERAW